MSTQQNIVSFCLFITCLFIITPVNALTYLNYSVYGGTYQDAEKSPEIAEDDKMCWAATASNMLNWSGWGEVVDDSVNGEDVIFKYFQDHWTNNGGSMNYAVDWWFDGSNDSQNFPKWSQVDVDGGGFYNDLDLSDYYHTNMNSILALDTVDSYLTEGYAVALGLVYGDSGHAVTCWGFEYDLEGNYLGVYITDSDDSKGVVDPSDLLKFYDVTYISGKWYLQKYFGHGNQDIFISEVHGLDRKNDTTVPEPASLLLFGLSMLAIPLIKSKNR